MEIATILGSCNLGALEPTLSREQEQYTQSFTRIPLGDLNKLDTLIPTVLLIKGGLKVEGQTNGMTLYSSTYIVKYNPLPADPSVVLYAVM